MIKSSVAAALAVLLVGCSSGPPAPTPDQKITVLAGHLATVDPPAGWTLSRVSLRGGSGFIYAQLGAEARLEALSIAPGERSVYFAIPCPQPGSPAWSAFRGHEDVYIAVNIDGRQRFLVPCRGTV